MVKKRISGHHLDFSSNICLVAKLEKRIVGLQLE